MPYLLTCQRALRAHVQACRVSTWSCLACSRVNVPCVLCVPTLESRIIEGGGIIGGLDIVIIINNRGGGWNNRGGGGGGGG